MWNRSKRLAELSLRNKLILAGLLPSVLVLLLAAIGFVAYDLVSFRASVRRDLHGQAQLIALTARASVEFRMFDHAERMLRALEGNPEVSAAAIYDETGTPVVQYFAAGREDQMLPEFVNKEPPRSPRGKFWLFEPMLLDGKTIATVFLESNFTHVWNRVWVLLMGALAALLLLLLVAYVFSTRLQRHITAPLYTLADTARAVSERNDYSVRVPEQPGPEFRLLTEAFNHMLGQIQAQDAELRTRAAQLENANAELEAFSYSVAHDLRAPLRSLSGFSHLITAKHASTLPEEAREYLGRIRVNAERMAALIDDLLALSQLEREPMKLAEVAPTDVVREALEELEPQLRGRTVEVTVDPLPAARADAALLRQVFVNLLSNALKYSRKQADARVHVGATMNNGRPIYFVQDNGVGFDMRYAQKLFRVFQRLHSSDEFEGTGVGLALVQRIVARHGGKIWAESEPDRGAKFLFTLN